MIFQRENASELKNPSAKAIVAELKKLRSYGPSSYAHLTDASGNFVQVAGGGGGMFLERHEASGNRHYRAYQATPVVPFADGTALSFTAGTVNLKSNEWFTFAQVVDVMSEFLATAGYPEFVMWRDTTEELGLDSQPEG